MKKEIRLLQDAELRAVADHVIAGYASVFDQPSLPIGGAHGFVERVRRGAFRNSLSKDVVGLYNHDDAAVLGRTTAGTMHLSEDAVGLKTEIHLPDTTLGRDVYQLVKRGDLRGMSFSFSTRRDAWNTSHTERELLDVELREVSVVAFPAYPQTSVQARSIGLPDDVEVLTYGGISAPAVSDEERRRLGLQLELLRRL